MENKLPHPDAAGAGLDGVDDDDDDDDDDVLVVLDDDDNERDLLLDVDIPCDDGCLNCFLRIDEEP